MKRVLGEKSLGIVGLLLNPLRIRRFNEAEKVTAPLLMSSPRLIEVHDYFRILHYSL